jgi:DNA polymerase-1
MIEGPELAQRADVAAPGNVLISCDWSQVEMRAAAWLSKDRVLTRVYEEGRDLHRETAAAIARVPYAAVTAAQRQAAKPVNFGAIYGIGPVTLAEDAFDNYEIELTEQEAQQALDRFFQTYGGYNDWRWDHWRRVKAVNRVVVPGRAALSKGYGSRRGAYASRRRATSRSRACAPTPCCARSRCCSGGCAARWSPACTTRS